jgi:hypothetical protein
MKLSVAAALHLEALLAEDVELLLKIDIVTLYKEEVLDIAQHWRMMSTIGNELHDRGADVGRLSKKVAQLLDTVEVSDEKDDVMDMWIYMLPA